jgi:hypothetical protein
MMFAHARYRPSRESLPFELGLMLVVGLFFAATGLFRSDQAPWDLRIIYWCSVMVVGGLIEIATEIAWKRMSSPRWNQAWRSLAPVSFIATLPQTLVVIFFEATLFGTRGDLGDLAATWFGVLVVMTAMVPLLRLSRIQLALHRTAAHPPVSNLDGRIPSLISDKLPAKLQTAELIALQAEDHYVRVFTSRGPELILLRFGDAMTAVSDLPGFRLHRSWWASEGAVEAARYSGGTGEAELTGGLKAPISRTYVAALRQAGIVKT